MKRETHCLPMPSTARAVDGLRRRGQVGITLLFTLGFLSVMLIMMLTLAMLSRTEKRSAAMNNHAVRARLVAETAVERALADLRVASKGKLFPGDTFAEGDKDSGWAGRRLLIGRDATGTKGDLEAGLEHAVSSTLAGRSLTPAESPLKKASWIPVLSKVQDGESVVDAIIGRYCYVVLDDSGRIDPGAVVHQDQSEQTDLATRFGYSLTDISLGELGFSEPDRFNYQDATYPGKMPNVGRWFSLGHMIRGVGMSQDDVELALRTLHPFSNDTEFFWRDRNGNGAWDAGEDSARLNLVASTDPSVLYQQFVGAVQSFSAKGEDGSDAGSDDCAWLKDLDNSAWFAAWRDRVFAGYAEPERTYRARASVAAQVAVNIADYADPDSEPTSVYLGNDGNIHLGSASATLTLHGIENNWGISEISMRVQGDVVLSEEESTQGQTTEGSDTVEDIEFTVVDGTVVPQESFNASVTILGVQLGMYNMARTPAELIYWLGVTADVTAGSDQLSPWGDYTNCYDNNLQDGNNPRNYDIPAAYPAGTAITVRSRYYTHPCSYNSRTGSYVVGSTWELYKTLSSSECGSEHVRVLVDGNDVPEISTVSNQNDVAYYLEDYVEDGKISLQPNQAIFLFETNDSRSSQDFQDLVALVTLRKADEEQLENTTTTFTMRGEVNINPNNSVDQFYITKPDGSQITRDDLHKYGEDYTGPATWIHLRPKGNGNENSITLNGVNYPLRNGRTYDFSGAFQIHLYNDKYVHGKAMGHWWIGLAGTEITVVEEGQTYVIEEAEEEEPTEEVVTTTTVTETVTEDANGMQVGSTGSDLRVRAGFQVELFYPFGQDEQLEFAPEGVTVQYTLQLATATGKTLNYTGTVDMLPTASENADGGTLLWTPEYSNGEWLTIEGAFDRTQDPAVDTYWVTMARIDSVTVKDRLYDVVDRVPSSNGPLCTWSASDVGATADQQFYADAKGNDPLMNDRGQDWADFDMFWSVTPEDRSLATALTEEVNGMGQIEGGYNSAPYSGIKAKNSPIERLGEIGRVHSYQPKQSLRLWSASSSDEAGHDASILDVFKVGSDVQTRGKINLNTRQEEVLAALFSGCTTVSTSQAVDAILDYRDAVGPFTNIGQAFGAVSRLTGSDPVQDELEESVVAALAEKITVRQNYFRVLICAQAIKDVRGVRYRDSDGDLSTAELGRFDAAYSSDGKFLRYVDRVLAEEKLMAVVYRDAYSGELTIQHVELLSE